MMHQGIIRLTGHALPAALPMATFIRAQSGSIAIGFRPADTSAAAPALL